MEKALERAASGERERAEGRLQPPWVLAHCATMRGQESWPCSSAPPAPILPNASRQASAAGDPERSLVETSATRSDSSRGVGGPCARPLCRPDPAPIRRPLAAPPD